VRTRLTAALVILFCSRLAMSQDAPGNSDGPEIRNWPAAPFWVSPTGLEKSDIQAPTPMAVEAVPTPPLPFTGINPCRIADTRGNGFAGAYGPPALAQGSPRNFVLTGQCGISGSAQAVSLNITVTNTQGPGFILIYPQGGSQPTVSTLNYVAGQTVANAAVVPLGTGGGVTVIAGVSGANLIIDTNGYYAPNIVTSINGSTGAVTIPVLPSASAGQTLRYNGTDWVANGALTSDGIDAFVGGTLHLPSTTYVTAGLSTLLHNTGSGNTFVGLNSGHNLGMPGSLSTGVGTEALFHGSGNNDTAMGYRALYNNAAGNQNTAIGSQSLQSNTTGSRNTAVGSFALDASTASSGNIAIGDFSGAAHTSGDDNVYLGNGGVATESGTIRIGSGGTHTRMFVAGVLNSGVTGTDVLISGTAQLGIATSSARFKQDIADMGDASDSLLKLRPVTFHYKGHTGDPLQYGLIAEEVEKVLPELVMKDADGQPQTVLYREMPAMLLNELQKQQRRIEAQDDEIAVLRKRLEALEERLSGNATK
jgi:Chaperone of endosialidase